MIKNNKKELLTFLINRWRLLAGFSAVERVHIATCNLAKQTNKPQPDELPNMIPDASLQITIIKKHIINILPETHFIDYRYETQVPLEPSDFIEMFIADHHQCINKVQDTIERLNIS